MLRPRNGYNDMSIAAFLAIVQLIVSRLLGNPMFVKLQAIVTQISDEVPTLIERIEKATNGSQADKELRNETRANITKLLHQLGFETAALVGDNQAMADASGVPFAKKSGTSPALKTPEPVILKSGVNPGEILCIGTKQQRTNQLTFFISTNPADENSWKPGVTKTSKCLFKGLVSGQRYYVKYVIAAAKGQEAISGVSSLVAL